MNDIDKVYGGGKIDTGGGGALVIIISNVVWLDELDRHPRRAASVGSGRSDKSTVWLDAVAPGESPYGD